jgi:hypothetical protein
MRRASESRTRSGMMLPGDNDSCLRMQQFGHVCGQLAPCEVQERCISFCNKLASANHACSSLSSWQGSCGFRGYPSFTIVVARELMKRQKEYMRGTVPPENEQLSP